MSIQITPIGVAPVLPAENTPTSVSHSTTAKTTAPPPPPPPPPPPQDTVSLSASIKTLQSEGATSEEIALTLGVPLQTVSIDLGTSFLQATLQAAPTIPSISAVAS